MLAIFSALMLAPAGFNPLPDCQLVRPLTFFEELSDLPPEIRTDFEARVGHIYPRSEKGVSFSDVIGPGTKFGKQVSFVAHNKNQWLISYVYGGIAIRTVTVSYLLNEHEPLAKPYLMGALEGDACDVANAFLRGISVEAGWESR